MRTAQIDPSTLLRSRRRLLMAALAAAVPALGRAKAEPKAQLVEVWKAPTCGCCGDWIKHLEANGLQVRVHDTGNNSARARLGMPDKYGSCHTALVGGYAIEGHVPAREIHRLLKERPDGHAGLWRPQGPLRRIGGTQGRFHDGLPSLCLELRRKSQAVVR